MKRVVRALLFGALLTAGVWVAVPQAANAGVVVCTLAEPGSLQPLPSGLPVTISGGQLIINSAYAGQLISFVVKPAGAMAGCEVSATLGCPSYLAGLGVPSGNYVYKDGNGNVHVDFAALLQDSIYQAVKPANAVGCVLV